MGSITKKFVSRSLTLALFLSLGYLALPLSPAAQGNPEAVILKQREAVRAQEQVKLQQHLAGQFAILQVQANSQHVMIEQWQKAHSTEPTSWSFTEKGGGGHKKRFR
jgi:hypothetical protein